MGSGLNGLVVRNGGGNLNVCFLSVVRCEEGDVGDEVGVCV